MRGTFFVLSIFFLISCNSQLKDKKHVTSSDSLRLAIQGVWEGYENEPIWDIGLDSIYYYSENKSYYYFIHGKDMIVLYKNGPFKFKNIRTANDTLFIRTGGINAISFRSKNITSKQNSGSLKNQFAQEIPIDTSKLIKGILGEWGYQYNKGLFSWIFTKDSITYIQLHKTYFYKLIENNVVVLTDEEPILMKDIIISADTMHFTANDSTFIKANKIH